MFCLCWSAIPGNVLLRYSSFLTASHCLSHIRPEEGMTPTSAGSLTHGPTLCHRMNTNQTSSQPIFCAK